MIAMKLEKTRLALINEYESAPDSALFSQHTIAAVRQCSVATVEHDRWAGRGVPFMKLGRLVRYRKADIRAWLESHRVVQSTTQAQLIKPSGMVNKCSGEDSNFVNIQH
jgi:hypothetical protein